MPLPCYTVSTLPDAGTHPNWVVCVSDGNVGVPCIAFSNGKNWVCLVQGLPVASS